MKMIYLACPYTCRNNPNTSEARYKIATIVAGSLMKDYVVFSPLTHSHPVSELGLAPHFDWDFWQRQDFAMIRKADEFWVLTIPGWQKSVGVQDELKLATELGKPINYCGLEFIQQRDEFEPGLFDRVVKLLATIGSLD